MELQGKSKRPHYNEFNCQNSLRAVRKEPLSQLQYSLVTQCSWPIHNMITPNQYSPEHQKSSPHRLLHKEGEKKQRKRYKIRNTNHYQSLDITFLELKKIRQRMRRGKLPVYNCPERYTICSRDESPVRIHAYRRHSLHILTPPVLLLKCLDFVLLTLYKRATHLLQSSFATEHIDGARNMIPILQTRCSRVYCSRKAVC